MFSEAKQCWHKAVPVLPSELKKKTQHPRKVVSRGAFTKHRNLAKMKASIFVTRNCNEYIDEIRTNKNFKVVSVCSLPLAAISLKVSFRTL